MSPRTTPIRNRQLARIHLLKAELKLTDDQYRAVLWTVGRVDSAAQLDGYGRTAVIRHLRSRLVPAAAQPAGMPPNLADRPLLHKVTAQLRAGNYPWVYGESLARRIAHKDRIEFCSDAELTKIVAALAYDATRKARKD